MLDSYTPLSVMREQFMSEPREVDVEVQSASDGLAVSRVTEQNSVTRNHDENSGRNRETKGSHLDLARVSSIFSINLSLSLSVKTSAIDLLGSEPASAELV
jgi:hypothetical protein